MDQIRKLLTLGSSDYSSLNIDSSLNEKVINAYFRIIERRSVYFPSLPRVWAFDTEFWKDWKNGDFEKIKVDLGTVELLKKDNILIPLQIPQEENSDHWCLILIKPKQFKIFAFDPLRLPRINELVSILKFVRQYSSSVENHFETSRWVMRDSPATSPKQTDEISSGVFVCTFADILSRNCSLSDKQIDSKSARKVISQVIRRGRFDCEDFSLIEPEDWRVRLRYAGIPVGFIPRAMIDFRSHDKKLQREVMCNPLFQELFTNDRNKTQFLRDRLFPPLVSDKSQPKTNESN